MLWLVTLWKQYEFRPHFSAIRLMCNYFFKRAILLYLIPVFIYYSSTEEIFVIYDGYARIVLFPAQRDLFLSDCFSTLEFKMYTHIHTHIYMRWDERMKWINFCFVLRSASRYMCVYMSAGKIGFFHFVWWMYSFL